jgi:hypothetical protein
MGKTLKSQMINNYRYNFEKKLLEQKKNIKKNL